MITVVRIMRNQSPYACMMLYVVRLYFVRISEKMVPINLNNRRSTANTFCKISLNLTFPTDFFGHLTSVGRATWAEVQSLEI